MKTRLKHALSFTSVMVCLLWSCAQADGKAPVQNGRKSRAGAGSLSSAESSDQIVFKKDPQTLGDVRAFGVALTDVDSDGDNDLFIANYIGPSKLWLNDGNGTFTDSRQKFEASSEQRAHDVAAADLNGDSYSDLFLLCHKTPSKAFLNDGSGGFTVTAQSIGASGDTPTSVVLSDVDCDGDVDAVLVFPRRPNRLWVNDGRGSLSRSNIEYGGRASHVMALADFNGDKFPDLFLGFLEQPGEVWLNNGAGKFRNTHQTIGDEAGCDGVITGDIDGDGDTDLVVSNIENGIGVWLNENGSGMLAELGPRFSPGTIKAQLLDADADGDLDLIAAQIEGGNRLWLNAGSRQFKPTDQFLGSTWAFCFAVGRIDSDDDLDVVIGSEVDGQHTASIYLCER